MHVSSSIARTGRCSLLCLFLFSPSFASAQANPPTQGTRRTVKNPLNDLLDEAQRDVERQDFAAAVAPLEKFIAEKDDFAFAHFELGYVYTALKRPADARREYEKAMALDPKMPEAPLNLGILLLDSDPAAAIAPLQKAVELLAAQSRPRFLLGVAEERSGNLKDAIGSYEAALRLDPKDTETALHLGDLYLREKKPAEAEKKFRSVLDADPASATAQLGFADSLAAQKSARAAEAYQTYLKSKPDDSAARGRYVQALITSENYEVALSELERESAGKPPSLELLKLRADVEIAQKKWDAAVRTLKQALLLAPEDAQLRAGLGRTYLQQKDFPHAERELRSALEIDRNNLDYWKDLSTTFYLSKNYTATLAALDVVAKAEPPGKGVWFIRALCYDSLRQPEQAIDAYERFLALETDKGSNQAWQAEQRIKVLKREVAQKH